MEAMFQCERPPPRIVDGESSLTSAGTPKLDALLSPVARVGSVVFYAAGRSAKPSGTTPVLT
jgi:hypothetical protein